MMSLIKKIRVRWFNHPPSENAIPLTTRGGAKYWVSYEGNQPSEITVGQYGKLCGLMRLTWSENQIDLGDFFIFPEHRWNGLGTAFLRFLIQFAKEKKIKRIDAIVAPESGLDFDRVLAWYIKNGFQRKSISGNAIFLNLDDDPAEFSE